MSVNPIPEGYRGLIPTLAVDDAAGAIDFYTRAFGATERMRMPGPDGRIAHAELELGGGLIMLADQYPQTTATPPPELGGHSGGVMFYVDDVDALVERAVAAGATITMPLENQFWGDRFGKLADPFGHEWSVATHVEEVSPDEMERRGREAMAELA